MRGHLIGRVIQTCNNNHPFTSAMQYGNTVEVKLKSLRDLGHAISELADMDGYYDSFNIDVNGNCGVFEVKFS